MSSKRIVLFVLSTVLIVCLLPFLGSEIIGIGELSDPLSPGYRIFFELRVPRLLFALFVGGSLAVLGGTYQTLFHNPLAEPYLLGVSSAVVLGVVSAHVFAGVAPQSSFAITCGLLAAMIATSLLVGLGLSTIGSRVERIILFGMGLNFVLSSILFLLLSFFQQQVGGGSMQWLFGHLPWVDPGRALWVSLVGAGFLAAIFLLGRHLDALSLGDGVARTMGFRPRRTRNYLIALSSGFLAVVVGFTGAIGFVGLVVPHVARLVFRPSTARQLLATSFVLGGVFLGACDAIARAAMPPFEFPIGIVTTLIGGPLFLLLLWRRAA